MSSSETGIPVEQSNVLNEFVSNLFRTGRLKVMEQGGDVKSRAERQGIALHQL